MGATRRALALLPLALLGCRGREGDLPGTWTSAKGNAYTIKADKSFTVTVRNISESGVWSISGDTVRLTLTQVNGEPVGELKAKMERRMATLTPRQRVIAQRMGKPETFRLGADGKTLTKTPVGATSVVLTKS